MQPLPWISQIKHVALDMDGTIYLGSSVFPCTLPFLDTIKGLGISHTFLTNNSSKSTRDYVRHLASIGVPATEADLFTSTDATVHYLRSRHPEVGRLFVLGTKSLKDELERAGFDVHGSEPQAVVAGFDTELTFERLCAAAYWIAQGKLFIATHPDRVCPTNLPTVLVDCGAVCAALQSATGRAPDAVPGKPSPSMVEGLLRKFDIRADELAIVGDRLYTDMAMARQAGARSVLVLSGETTSDQASSHTPAPDLVLNDVGELGVLLSSVRGSTAG